jgi:hypothetical protein
VDVSKLTPENFRELLSASMFVIALIFSFLSLSQNLREHSLRMTGLFLLGSLSLFAHNGWAYFAAVFIVATAVTQLGFLQNLAAIIRGSKEYFDYQKEFLTRKEVETSIEKETKAIEAVVPETKENQPEITDGQTQKVISLTVDETNLTVTQFYLLVEEYTFRFLEKKYGKPIQKYVRFKGKNFRAEFDGIMQVDSSDLIFEIKSSRRNFLPVGYILESMRNVINKAKEYKEITNRTPILRYILVGNFKSSFITNLIKRKDELLQDESGIDFALENYPFDEIGLSNLEVESLKN